MPRKTRLTAAVRAKIAEFVGAGCHLTVAAGQLGIPESTVTGWFRRGEKEESGPYFDFTNTVRRADAEHEAKIVAVVVRAAEIDPRYGIAYLRAKYAKRWKPSDRIEVSTGDSEAPDAGAARDRFVARFTELLRAERDTADLVKPAPLAPVTEDTKPLPAAREVERRSKPREPAAPAATASAREAPTSEIVKYQRAVGRDAERDELEASMRRNAEEMECRRIAAERRRIAIKPHEIVGGDL